MNTNQHLDDLLQQWPFEPEALGVRLLKGEDGRDIIQLRVDLGILQLETTGRPDGLRPEGHATLLELLQQREGEDPTFELDDEISTEIDREFVQFYHRRVAWLRLQRFDRAVEDADHTLDLMDFCRENSPCEEWTFQHEQHRAFVLFHRSQACALAAIEDQMPAKAIEALDQGLEQIRESFEELGWEDQFESDELVERLIHLRESLTSDFSIEKSLSDQLSDAVASEQYELAAELRDRIAQREEA
ncbi:UvrB/UvrC motif-containing protein [Aureliella helgolandensis]|uniref:UvrB/uvrC motif protein n=1 Tax=Aureliella helgolandensis TaxID=2527968 RepID=A0A518GCD1_9BACT|nr:UvrB/UvrC motif-containing protein [Aureliella helgolandensis]QDV26255.1 UvrB/uvrC motif protein [Aureliella helgolandensis]